jgi:hypothetical protein
VVRGCATPRIDSQQKAGSGGARRCRHSLQQVSSVGARCRHSLQQVGSGGARRCRHSLQQVGSGGARRCRHSLQQVGFEDRASGGGSFSVGGVKTLTKSHAQCDLSYSSVAQWLLRGRSTHRERGERWDTCRHQCGDGVLRLDVFIDWNSRWYIGTSVHHLILVSTTTNPPPHHPEEDVYF